MNEALILYLVSLLSPLLPLILCYKQRHTLLWKYILVAFVFDILTTVLKRGLHIPHHPVTNTFILTEFILLAFIYKKELSINPILFYIPLAVISIFFITDTVPIALYELNTVGASTFSIVYIILAVTGLYKMLADAEGLNYNRSYFFWLNVAILVYASGILFLFLFKDYLKAHDNKLFSILWSIFFRSLNTFKNIFLTLALYYKPATWNKQ